MNKANKMRYQLFDSTSLLQTKHKAVFKFGKGPKPPLHSKGANLVFNLALDFSDGPIYPTIKFVIFLFFLCIQPESKVSML